MKYKLKKNQRLSNVSETPCINSQSGTAVTVYTRDARGTLPRAAIPPFVFIKSYYWPCKNFNARGGNLLKPTSICRHYTQNNFFLLREVHLPRIMFPLENYFADIARARARFHDSANYSHYRNILVQFCRILHQIIAYNREC